MSKVPVDCLALFLACRFHQHGPMMDYNSKIQRHSSLGSHWLTEHRASYGPFPYILFSTPSNTVTALTDRLQPSCWLVLLLNQPIDVQTGDGVSDVGDVEVKP